MSSTRYAEMSRDISEKFLVRTNKKELGTYAPPLYSTQLGPANARTFDRGSALWFTLTVSPRVYISLLYGGQGKNGSAKPLVA